MFGESDVVLKRERQEKIVALKDSMCLKIEANKFMEIIEKFEFLKKDLMNLIRIREKLLK